MRHILLKTTGKPAADEAKIKAQAEDLLKQIRGGANFSELAKKILRGHRLRPTTPRTRRTAGLGDARPDRAGVRKGGVFPQAGPDQRPGQDAVRVSTSSRCWSTKMRACGPSRRPRPTSPRNGRSSASTTSWRTSPTRPRRRCRRTPRTPRRWRPDFNMQLVKRGWRTRPAGRTRRSAPTPDFDQAVAGLKVGEASAAGGLARQ